jgi:hypothetical protein
VSFDGSALARLTGVSVNVRSFSTSSTKSDAVR